MGSLGFATLGSDLVEQVKIAQKAEQSGLNAVWASELYDHSATVSVAAMSLATEAITVGTGIAWAFGRTPLVLAVEARDIDAISNGRFRLGLGTGPKAVQEMWHGLDGLHPAPKLEELVPLLRRLWRLHEEPVIHQGRFFRCEVTPTTDVIVPHRVDIPVYLSGVNERMLKAAGAVADGFVGHPLFTPEYVAQVVRPTLDTEARAKDRPMGMPISGYVLTSVDEDSERARRMAASQLAWYCTIRSYDALHEVNGFVSQCDEIRRAWRAGGIESATEKVTDEMLETYAVAGTPAEATEQIRRRWLGVYDELVIYPPSVSGSPDSEYMIDALSSLVGA